MLYNILKSVILNKGYTAKEDMQIKLDVFFASNRITQEQYTELTEMLASA